MSPTYAQPRLAVPADSAALCRLASRVPMLGPVSYCLERDPDFFALTRLQGDAAQVFVIDEPGTGELAAMGTHVPQLLRWNGVVRRVSYLADLKVDPKHRGTHLGASMMEVAGAFLASSDACFGYGIVLAGNPLMAPIINHDAAALRFTRLSTVRNHTLFFRPLLAFRHEGTVRAASVADIPAMVELWNRQMAVRELTRAWTAQDLRDRLARTPGLSFDDFLVVERGGLLTGFAAAWDASAIKRVRLLRTGRALRCVRGAYNPSAALLSLPRVPAEGDVLPIAHVSPFCADTPGDLRALLARLCNTQRHAGRLCLDIALDRRDPLAAALRGFVGTRLDFELFAVQRRAASRVTPSTRPAHFDIALV